MPVAWKIIAYKRPKEIGDLSTREFFLVALPESEAAIAVLRMREGYNDAELEVTGQASAESARLAGHQTGPNILRVGVTMTRERRRAPNCFLRYSGCRRSRLGASAALSLLDVVTQPR